MNSTRVTPEGRIVFREDGNDRQWTSLADLAASYLDYVRLADRAKESADFCPWEAVHDLVGPPAWSGAIQLIETLVAASSGERDIGMIAAGPLQDLVTDPNEGPRFVDAIEANARRDSQWRAAVAAVWLDREADPLVNRRLATYGAHYPDGTRP